MSATIPRPFVFVLMPFDKTFDDLYLLGIKPACEAAGAYSERVDEQIFEGTILARIYNQIAKSDVVISEMTGRNPNVFYETGYAHALGRRTVLLTKDATDIPFDLKNYPPIIHGGQIHYLKQQLEARVRWLIEHPSEKPIYLEFPLEIYVDGIPLKENPEIFKKVPNNPLIFSFELAFHNPMNVPYVTNQPIGLIMEPGIGFDHGQEITLPNGSCMQYMNLNMNLMPDQWSSERVFLTLGKLDVDSCRPVIRVFTEIGPIAFSFKISFTYEGI